MPTTRSSVIQWPQVSTRNLPRLIVAMSLLLGLAFYYCFWNQLPGISVFVYAVLATVVVGLFCRLVDRPWSRSMWVVSGAIEVLALFISVRTSTPMLLLNGLTIVALGLVAVWLLRGGPWRMLLSNYGLLAFLPVFWIIPLLRTLIKVVAPARARSSQATEATIRGLVLTIPVVLVLLFLFIGSDDRLAVLFDNLFTFSLSFDSLAGWFVVGIVTLWFTAALSYVMKQADLEMRVLGDQRLLGIVESRILLGGVVVVFGLYLLSQMYYLFGGESYLADNAITYAAYARQGFGQLIMAALIALGVIWATKPYISDEIWVRRLGLVLGGLVLIILASAASRLWLYERAYGFTYLRLFGHAFMIWLAGVLIIVLSQIWRRLDGLTAGPAIVGLAVVVLLGINFLNPDVFIVRQNIARYHDIGKIDMSYIRYLSDDAIPEVAQLLDEDDATLRTAVSQILIRSSRHRGEDDSLPWQSWNVSRQRAEEVVEQAATSPNFTPKGPVGLGKPVWQD